MLSLPIFEASEGFVNAAGEEVVLNRGHSIKTTHDNRRHRQLAASAGLGDAGARILELATPPAAPFAQPLPVPPRCRAVPWRPARGPQFALARPYLAVKLALPSALALIM